MSGLFSDDPREVYAADAPFEMIILDRLRSAVFHRVSTEFARECRANVHHVDYLINQMMIRLERDLLAHRVGLKTSEVPVRARMVLPEAPEHVLVVVPPGRLQGWLRSGWRDRMWWLNWTRRPLRKVWAPVGGRASVQLEVRGTATVRGEYFNTFPQAQIPIYSDRLGPVVERVQISEPDDFVFRTDGF